MALIAANLVAVLPLVGGNRLHDYPTPDALATVAAANYFNAATGLLRKDDVIMVRVTGTAALEHYIVSSATGAATVTIVAAS